MKIQPKHALKEFQMSLERFRLVDLAFAINVGFKKKHELVEIRPQIAVAHKYDDKKKALDIRIKVTLSNGNTPFTFMVTGEGRFVFKAAPDKQTIANVANINGPAIVFPYVRETIADMTRRAGFQPLHLQPINFVRLAAKKKQTAASP
ncbi:MAG: protein-export chaperone SecB [Deltaproteobacteria bacterium]|nr:protein-export chaperone SecB [Deltaproteobacteria bacterium]